MLDSHSTNHCLRSPLVRSILVCTLTVVFLTVACQSPPTPTPTPTAIPPPPTSTTILATVAVPSPTATKSTQVVTATVDLKGRALKVGSDTTYPPFESVNAKNEIVGFDVDLVNEICKRINCKATFVTADFDKLLDAVKNNTYDLSASGWTITSERAKSIDFGLPYMPNTLILLVRSSETRVKEPEDLKNPAYNVGVQFDAPSSATVKQLVADSSKQITEFQDLVAAVQALLNRQVDVVVVNIFDAVDLIDQNQNKIKATGKQFGAGYLGMVFRKGDLELKPAFDAGLKAVYQDGTWSKLCDAWWKDINPKPDCKGTSLTLGK